MGLSYLEKDLCHPKNRHLLDGIPYVMRQLNPAVLCFVYTRSTRPSTSGLLLNVGIYKAKEFSDGRKGKDGNAFALSFLLKLLPSGDLCEPIKINLFLRIALSWMMNQRLQPRINYFQNYALPLVFSSFFHPWRILNRRTLQPFYLDR